MLFPVLSFVTGIIVVQQFSVLPETFWVLALLFVLPLVVFLRYWLLVFFVVGVLWAIFFANMHLAGRLPNHLQGKHIQIKGKVVGIPQYDERRVRFDFSVSKSKSDFPKKIRLSWYFPKQVIKSGQYWQFTVKLKKPHGRFNSGTFDYERWLFVQNIGATGYIRTFPTPKLLETDSSWQGINVLRQFIADELTVLLKNSDYAGVIKALTIGERADISDQQWDVFKKTGVVHLLAISGLHIGLISGLVYFLVLKISTRFLVSSPQIMAALSAVFIALFYSALAGFSIPTQRSLLMLVIAMNAIVWQRNITVTHTLAFTVLAVVIFDPLAVLSAGFWLSFLAVAIIVYSLAGRLGKAGHWYDAIKIHWVAALGLSPLLLFYFQQFSIIAPIANFIAVPVISLLIVPLCFIAVVAMSCSSVLAGYVLFVVDKLLQILWFVLLEMAELPFATITAVPPPFYALVFAFFGVLLLLSPKGMPARWLGLVLLLPLFFNKPDQPKPGEVVMTLLDVGQGLSTVIETANHTLVFDAGAKYSESYDMGSAVVIPFLRSKGVDIIDKLLISHADNDHIGGAKSVISQSQVKQVISSVPVILKHYNSIKCKSGQFWDWDQVYFEILMPDEGTLKGDNNNSCVLKVSSKHGSILLTGDIEAEAEKWLLKNKMDKLDSDILISPHHGSKTSSTLMFLKAVSPNKVLIPSGYRNRFSFPHKATLKRYEQINATWKNTADAGAIVVNMKKNRRIVKSLRLEQGKYWN